MTSAPSSGSHGVRAVLSGFGTVVAAATIAGVMMFAAIAFAGGTVAGGERAAMAAGLLDLALCVAAPVAFFLVNGGLRLPARLGVSVLVALVTFVTVVPIFFLTVLSLNR